MPNDKPYVAVATFCEKVLREADGVMSAIRIVDTFTVESVTEAPVDVIPLVPVTGMIALKSGDLVGKYVLGLVLENTKGERTTISPEGGWPVVFGGGEHGIQLQFEFLVAVQNFGLVWFDVMFGDEVLTRMPVRLKAQEQSAEETQHSPKTLPDGLATPRVWKGRWCPKVAEGDSAPQRR